VRADFEYNFKSILPIPGKALKAKRIWVAGIFILGSFILYDFLTFLAVIIDGRDFGYFWSIYGLFPLVWLQFSSGISQAIYMAGIAVSGFVLAVGMIALAVFDFEDMRGNPFLSWPKAVGFAAGRIGQLFRSWAAILVFLAFIVILALLAGLLTRIPVVGEVIFGLFFFFPAFIVALFTVLIIFVFMLSFLIMPVAVAADRRGESFSSILETFNTVTREPWRWSLYTAYSVLAAKVGSFVLAYFAFRAVQFLRLTIGLTGGAGVDRLIASGADHLPLSGALVDFTTGLMPGLGFGFDITGLGGGVIVHGPGSFLTAISLFLIFVMIWAYVISIIVSGQARAYAVIKFRREGYRIDEEASFFESATEFGLEPDSDETNKTDDIK